MPRPVGYRFTHCKQGHDFSVPENVYTAPDGERGCKVCRDAKAKVRYQRNKSKISAYAKEWYATGGGRKLAREVGWVRTGWTPELFYKTLEKQDNKCAICLKKIGFKDERLDERNPAALRWVSECLGGCRCVETKHRDISNGKEKTLDA